MKFFTCVCLVILGCSFAPPSALGQCAPMNDGFSAGPCCTPAAPSLPVFPALTLAGLGACIRDCGLESQFSTTATLSPVQVLCDHWLFFLNLSGPPSVSIGGGNFLVGKYVRTWVEFPVPGAPPLQVWRFLVNGDLAYGASPASAAGCPVPLSALPPYSLPVHFVGNVDYAFDCVTGAWQVAYTLTHFCPTEMHAPFSQRPLPAAAGWPKRTYHFVGPANFVFGVCAAPDGNFIAQSFRQSFGLVNPAVPYTCLHESPGFFGGIQIVNDDCVCFDPTPIAPPSRYRHQSLGSAQHCGASGPLNSFAGFGLPFMPTGLRALMLGSWMPVAGSGGYPGARCVSIYLGVLEGTICPGPGPLLVLHAATGVGTTGGNVVQLLDGPTSVMAPLEFLDLQEMLVLTAAGTFTPGIGSLFASEAVWSFNSL